MQPHSENCVIQVRDAVSTPVSGAKLIAIFSVSLRINTDQKRPMPQHRIAISIRATPWLEANSGMVEATLLGAISVKHALRSHPGSQAR